MQIIKSDNSKNALSVWTAAGIISLFLIVWFFAGKVFAETHTTLTPLPAEQAFSFSASLLPKETNDIKTNTASPHLIMLEWRVAPGYYLYSKRIHIKLDPPLNATIRIPQGDLKYDKQQGRLEVFSGTLTVPVELQAAPQQVKLTVDYQGCSQSGFCYPPTTTQLMVNFTDNTISKFYPSRAEKSGEVRSIEGRKSVSNLLVDQYSVQALFQDQSLGVMLLIFIVIGLFLSFTPCCLPMIPILTSIIIGQKTKATARKAFLLSTFYVLGVAVTYAMAGLLAAYMGSSLQVWLQKPWIIYIVCTLFILLALSLFGFYDLKLPNHWHNKVHHWSNKQRGGTYAGVFAMGILSTLIVSPCVTAPLIGVLLYIGQSGDLVLGASALFAMGLGMGIPLVFIGTTAGKWLPRSGRWMEAIKDIFGILMLAMAIWLATRVASTQFISILWSLLLLGCGLFIGIRLPHLIGLKALNQLLGVLLGSVGLGLFIMASMPSLTGGIQSNETAEVKGNPLFTVIRDIDSLKKQLTLAQTAGKPVILDFYADWCESCLVMERTVFSTSDVQRVLQHYILLRADLTANTEADQMLMKSFNVIAPPTVIFFAADGRELNSQRIVGEVDAKEFLVRLKEACKINRGQQC